MGEADHAVEVKRVHQNLPTTLRSRTEGQARAIGRDARRKGNASEMRDLRLVGAVVIHCPDFFVAGAVAYKIDFAFGDAGNTAAEAEDDFVGELVRDYADGIAVGGIAVLLAQDLRRGLILQV